jgi:hypothetical protein
MQTEAYIEGTAHVLDDYVDAGTVVRRPEMAVELVHTSDGCRLSGLPVPCVIRVNCTDYPCETEEEEIIFDQPGTYKIKISAWPYFDKEFSLEYSPS